MKRGLSRGVGLLTSVVSDGPGRPANEQPKTPFILVDNVANPTWRSNWGVMPSKINDALGGAAGLCWTAREK